MSVKASSSEERQRKTFGYLQYGHSKPIKFGDSFKPMSPEEAQEKLDSFFRTYVSIRQWRSKITQVRSIFI